jgi:hypothetical protein
LPKRFTFRRLSEISSSFKVLKNAPNLCHRFLRRSAVLPAERVQHHVRRSALQEEAYDLALAFGRIADLVQS